MPIEDSESFDDNGNPRFSRVPPACPQKLYSHIRYIVMIFHTLLLLRLLLNWNLWIGTQSRLKTNEKYYETSRFITVVFGTDFKLQKNVF